MRQPSNSTRALIEQLHQLLNDRGLLRRESKSAAETAVEMIKRIADSGDGSAICPYLVVFLALPDSKIANAAVECVESLLANMRPAQLLPLDERLRGGLWADSMYSRYGRHLWDGLKPDTYWQKLWDGLLPSGVVKQKFGYAAMTSFHRNGHMREAALRQLSTFTDGRELPFLIIRLSDWVPQVRTIAELAIEKRLHSDYLQHFIDNLALLDMVKRKQRVADSAKGRELIYQLMNLLFQPPGNKLLHGGLKHEDFEVRRACLSFLVHEKVSDISEVINLVLLDKNLTNRRAVLGLVQELPIQDLLPVLSRLLKDKAPSIRRGALQRYCAANGSDAREFLESSLLDKAPMVRECARWELSNLGANIDYRDFYLKQLASALDTNKITAAVSGLGETCKQSDAYIIEPFLQHGELQVEKVAITALARLDAARYIERFLELLKDDRPGVSRLAANALAKTIVDLDADDVLIAITSPTEWHVKRHALYLLNQFSKWERIISLLAAAKFDDVRVRDLALLFIQCWSDQYRTSWQFTLPDSRQRERLASGISGLAGILDPLPEALQQCFKICCTGV